MRIARKLPTFGDLYTVEQFKEKADSGELTNDNGFGRYSDGGETYWDDAHAWPSKVVRDGVDVHYTHVIWFSFMSAEERHGEQGS